MHRAEKPNDHLRAFARAVDPNHDLAAEIEHLLVLAVRAVPACVAISVVLPGRTAALVVTALSPGATAGPVLASLAIELPRPGSDHLTPTRPTLVLYGRVAKAFDGMAPSLRALLDLSHRRITVDSDLVLPDVAAQSEDWSQQLRDDDGVAQAIGVLLDRGMLPADGHLELQRLAARDGVSSAAAAWTVVASVARPELRPPE